MSSSLKRCRLSWYLWVLLTLVVLSTSGVAQVAPVDPPKPHREVQALLEKGNQASGASRFEEALRSFNEALDRARTLDDKAGEGRALNNIADVYFDTNQFPKALEFYEKSLPPFRQVGDKVAEAKALGNIGLVYNNIGQPQKALSSLEQALPLFRQAGHKAGEARTQMGIGDIYSATGQPQKALDSLEQALPLYRQARQKRGEADVLNKIGHIYFGRSQLQKALDFYQQALPLYKEAVDPVGETYMLNNMGNVYYRMGQLQKALDLHLQVLLHLRRLGLKADEADVLNALGNTCFFTGQHQKALDFYQQALLLFRQLGKKAGEIGPLLGTGNVYSMLGQHQKALDFYQQALFLYQQMKNKAEAAKVLMNIGNVYNATGQPRQALAYYQQSLAVSRQNGDKVGEAGALESIGVVHNQSLGKPKKALEFYQQALLLFRQAGEKRGEASVLTNIGWNYYGLGGHVQKALEFYQQALPLSRKLGDKSGEAGILLNFALVEEQRGQLAQAEHHLEGAVALIESVRDELGGLSEAKVSFLSSELDTYRRYVHVLLKQNKTAEAFAIVQKTKARALLDLMASGKVDLHQQMTPAETQQERELRTNADQLNAQMVKEGVQNEVGAKKRFAALKAQLAQAESNLQKFTDALYARHPDLARKRGNKTATLAEVARFLPADTALLEYVVLKEDKKHTGKDALDETVLFVVTNTAGNAAIRTYSLAVKEEALTNKTAAMRLACSDPEKPYQKQARGMRRVLLPPAVVRQLSGKKRLIICPDGPLWDVPFAALQDGDGRFLLERHELAFAYSATGAQATVLAGAKEQHRVSTAPGTLLALANPDFDGEKRFGDDPTIVGQRPIPAPSRPIPAPSRPIPAPSRELIIPRGGRIIALPGTQREADMLHKRFPGAAIYTHGEAQEARVKTEAGHYRYLHLASHAFFNDGAPLLSSIVLARPPQGSSEDGFLTAREIFDMDLSGASMVVLSACNTARGEKRTGEGIVGLTWALFVAGVPTQVLSQWAVDDASTAALMDSFYGALTQGEEAAQTKGSALRSAALELRKNRKYAHPYYWAPFVLMGDWRK